MKKIILLLLFLTFGSSVGASEIELVYKIYKVDSPAPTIIIGHHCGGTGTHDNEWAKQLNRWGFNAVVLDSFTPRNAFDVCKNKQVPTWKRTEETYKVAELIKSEHWHKGKIGYIGHSHGGSTAIYIASDRNNKHIDAAVAYYPYCGMDYGNREITTASPKIKLMLALAKLDDWTPYQPCMNKNKNLEIHLYENATHSFDQHHPGWARIYLNYLIKHDTQANIDSRVATRLFFKKYLEGIIEDESIARSEFTTSR